MNEPRFVDRPTVDALHRISLEQQGGQDGLRNEHGLESALAQPRNAYLYGNGDRADLAAAYAFHIAENQAYIDGNKRTAMLAALYFLEINGADTSGPSDDELYDAMIGIAEKRIDKASLAATFRRHLSP